MSVLIHNEDIGDELTSSLETGHNECETILKREGGELEGEAEVFE